MAAIFNIQILAAFDAQTFALGVVQWLDRHFEQRIFTQDWGEVYLCAFRQDQTHFINWFIVEGKQFGDLPGQVMRKILLAAYTFNCGVAFKVALNDKSLLRSPNMHRAHNVSEFEVINNDLADFKRKFMAVADFLMDNKADINAEGFAGISHGLFLIK